MSGTLEEIDSNEEENQQNKNKGGNNQSQDNSKTISQINDKSKDDLQSDNTDLQFNYNVFQNDNEQNKSSENTNPVQIDQNKLAKTSNEQAAVQESLKKEEEEEERRSDDEGMNENKESTSNISNLLINSQKDGADKSEKVKKNDGKLNAPMNNFISNNKLKNQNAGNTDNNSNEKMIKTNQKEEKNISKGPSLEEEEEKHDNKATVEEVHEKKNK